MGHIDWHNPAKLRWRAAQVGFWFRHWREHQALCRLLSRARNAGLLRDTSLHPWKYLGHYLTLRAGFAERRDLLADHYGFLLDRLAGTAIAGQWAGPLVLWRNGRYTIVLSEPTFSRMEGESRLTFEADDRILWTLTFVIGHACRLDIGCGHVLVIGGLQGGRNSLNAIRRATRENARLRPHALLAVAVRALSSALEIERIVIVSGPSSPVNRYRAGDVDLFDRDRFWRECGAHNAASGLLDLPLRDPVGWADRDGQAGRLKWVVAAAVREAIARFASCQRPMPLEAERTKLFDPTWQAGPKG